MPVDKSGIGTDLDELRSKLSECNELPYCSGTVPLSQSAAKIFYITDGLNAKVIDFVKPVEGTLEDLAKACQPATFGLNQEDVLDESYRKAGKMDSDKFATQFSPSELGVMAVIEDHLLQGRKIPSIRAEMYKLNIYGPGAFFKSHIDTPRSDTMFGSLVVVLPTPHEGGSLICRHDERQWTFDSSKIVKTDPPQAAFAAFYSDVEHEVLPVTSGYRVTLTYNLYFSAAHRSELDAKESPETIAIKESLREPLGRLLRNFAFLPGGGVLGFGLSHKYPVNTSTKMADILEWLKGPDAGIKALCTSFNLEVAIKAVYREEWDGGDILGLFDEFVDFKGSMAAEDGIVQRLARIEDDSVGKIVEDVGDGEHSYSSSYPNHQNVVWVKPLEKVHRIQQSYAAYGNEATLDHTYVEVCLVATVAEGNDRNV